MLSARTGVTLGSGGSMPRPSCRRRHRCSFGRTLNWSSSRYATIPRAGPHSTSCACDGWSLAHLCCILVSSARAAVQDERLAKNARAWQRRVRDSQIHPADEDMEAPAQPREFTRAFADVESRAFQLWGEHNAAAHEALVPMLDVANHSETANATFTYDDRV